MHLIINPSGGWPPTLLLKVSAFFLKKKIDLIFDCDKQSALFKNTDW